VDGVDLPPCRQCAPLWQPRFRAALPAISLTLLVGSYAHAYYLGRKRKPSVAETVRAWREYLPEYFVLPHPSWRNLAWMKKNVWFAGEVIPALRRRVKRALRPV
jgi:uracil-DNA glycosylase